MTSKLQGILLLPNPPFAACSRCMTSSDDASPSGNKFRKLFAWDWVVYGLVLPNVMSQDLKMRTREGGGREGGSGVFFWGVLLEGRKEGKAVGIGWFQSRTGY